MCIEYMQSVKGTAPENEDAVGYHENYCWVIDGATSLFDNPIDPTFTVADIANDISDTLPEHCDDNKSLADILHDTIDTVAKYRLYTAQNSTTQEQYAQLPTFAIMLIRATDSGIDYLSLGDCYLEVKGKTYTDNRIAPFAQKNRERIQNIIHKQGSITSDERKTIFQETRLKANAADGYPIGSLDPLSAYAAKTGAISLHGESVTAMLYSDGFKDCYIPGEPIENSLKNLTRSQAIDETYGKRDDATVLVVKA